MYACNASLDSLMWSNREIEKPEESVWFHFQWKIVAILGLSIVDVFAEAPVEPLLDPCWI